MDQAHTSSAVVTSKTLNLIWICGCQEHMVTFLYDKYW
jgi:hypothetical protein